MVCRNRALARKLKFDPFSDSLGYKANTIVLSITRKRRNGVKTTVPHLASSSYPRPTNYYSERDDTEVLVNKLLGIARSEMQGRWCGRMGTSGVSWDRYTLIMENYSIGRQQLEFVGIVGAVTTLST